MVNPSGVNTIVMPKLIGSNDPIRFVILNFGHCDLLFAIWDFSPKLKNYLFDQTGCMRPEAALKIESRPGGKPLNLNDTYTLDK
jgi:hypothetical protein